MRSRRRRHPQAKTARGNHERHKSHSTGQQVHMQRKPLFFGQKVAIIPRRDSRNLDTDLKVVRSSPLCHPLPPSTRHRLWSRSQPREIATVTKIILYHLSLSSYRVSRVEGRSLGGTEGGQQKSSGSNVLTLTRSVKHTYRDRLKGLYVVARNFFLLLLNFSAWPCLAVA